MNNNMNQVKARPRSVKPKRRTGFTMMEMMITLAIMAVLFGLAVPAVAAIQKNLEIARLNSYAKDVYLAAQNRLTSLKATGELVELRDALQDKYSGEGGLRNRYYGPSDPDDLAGSSFKPQDWNDDWDLDSTGAPSAFKKYFNFYGIMHNPTDAEDNDPIITEIIPEVSVTSTALDHHYYVEFNPTTGDVYAAFYTDAKTGFTAADIRDVSKIPYGDENGKDSGRAKAHLRDNFVNSAGDNIMLGYYRGDPTDMLEDKEITEYDVTCELVNKEDLYVKVTCDLGDTYFLRKFIDATVTITNAGTGDAIEIPLDLSAADSLRMYDRSMLATNKFAMFGYDATDTTKFVAYILLDALDKNEVLNGTPYSSVIDGLVDTYKDADGNAGKDLTAFANAVKVGCNLQASANVELNFADRIVRTSEANNTDEHLQNSRFAAISDDGKTVNVGYVRHLANLDNYSMLSNRLNIEQSCVEYVIETYYDPDTGEEKTRTVEKAKGDIYFNAKYEGGTGGDDKWYWTPDYLIGEPTGNALRNYLNAPDIANEAYIAPLTIPNNYKPITFNGKHYGMYDFVIAGADAEGNTGLFGTMERAVFSNVNLIDTKVDGNDADESVGALVGDTLGCQFNNVGVRLTDRDPVQNKHYPNMTARVETLKVASENAEVVGGIVGTAKGCFFDYSYAAIQVQGNTTDSTVGGLVGEAEDCEFKGCYTSEPTIGGRYVGGFVGHMDGGSAMAEQNGTSTYPLYATGDVFGSVHVGGFVGFAEGLWNMRGCNSFGRVRANEGTTPLHMGGFIGRKSGHTYFDKCSYLKQTRYNTGAGYVSQEGIAVGRAYDDVMLNNGYSFWNVMSDAATANTAEDSHPYTVYARADVFPFAMTQMSMTDGYDEIPHYGDWPVEASIQTMLAYYEVYQNDDGSTSMGLYGNTSLVGEATANNWQINTLQTGDTYCIEDGYAIVSTDMMTQISGTIETLGGAAVTVNYTQPDSTDAVRFTSSGSWRDETVYVYKLNDLDVQGMSTEYQDRMNGASATYFQRMVLSGVYNSDEVFTDYTFFYCPVLAKSAINPTPQQADDPSLCPTTAAMEINKPEAGIVRSARQLNAMGRMTAFWNMNLTQECHVDFGKYTKSYCDEAIDLSGSGQTVSNAWRNKPIGTNTVSGRLPYTGVYDGGFYKIIDYCLSVSEDSDSVDVGLFGLLYNGTVQNVVLMASDPNANAGAGSAWVKSTMAGYETNAASSIAPLVGRVEYDSAAYAATGGTNRVLKTWGTGGDAFDKYAISDGTLKIAYNQMGTTSGGTWSNTRDSLTPQNSSQYALVTVQGDFGTVIGATLTSHTADDTFFTVNATTIRNGELVFNVPASTCRLVETPESVDPDTGEVTPASSRRKMGTEVRIALTGGDLSNWTTENTTFHAELYSSEAVVPTGDEPSSYITGISNMSTIKNCAVAGYIVDFTPAETQTKPVYVGGLVGKNQGEIYNCSASNKRLSVSGSSGDALRYLGGFAGVNDDGIIANCYSGGLLAAMGTQPARVGGLVGQQEKSGTPRAWCAGGTKLISSYSYCSIENNTAPVVTFSGVAGGSDSMIRHSHFFENSVKEYSEDVFNALADKTRTYTTTINNKAVTIPYSLTYSKMKKLFKGSGFALFGPTGIANFEHSWPYDQTLAGNYPFPATVMDDDGYFVHYGDWPAPNGTIYTNTASFGGVFWNDFCVDATEKTDYNYYWGDWLKELKYQASIGELKTGDYIEIVVEPEFEYDRPEAAGKFQCAIHSMLEDTGRQVWDEENDAAYEAQGINFSNGQVYQFLFDVEGSGILTAQDPQLWFAVNYHSKSGAEGELWDTLNKRDSEYYPGHTDPFRLNRLTVNIYREDNTSSTTNATTRHSTTTLGEGETTSVEDDTHLELKKSWTFEEAGAANILMTDSGPQLAGDISTTLFAGNSAFGHSNHIQLQNATSFRMDVSEAFNNEEVLKKNECYQVEATFALGPGAEKDMTMRPYLVSGDDMYYASTYTLVQKRASTGANAGKVIWANAVYTFGSEGMTIDDDAYIVWIPREQSTNNVVNTLTGDLYVDNVSVKKVAQGPDPTKTSATKPTVPVEDDAKLVARWETDAADTIVAPTYETSAKNNYRYIEFNSSRDIETGLTWKNYIDSHEGLSATQYMMVTLTYPEGYAHAEKGNFTFTCDSYSYKNAAGGSQILSEIDPAVGEDAFDAENRTIKWIVNGPLEYSDLYKFRETGGTKPDGSPDKTEIRLRSYFTYRNALDLLDNTVLMSNKDQFNICIEVYDRDLSATAMTTKATTRPLTDGTVGHSWTSLDGEITPDYNWIKPQTRGLTETGETLTFAEFVAQNSLDATQYLQVTALANDAGNPIICGQANFASMNLKAFMNANGDIYNNVPGESMTANSVVFHVNGVLSPVTGDEKITFTNVVGADGNGRPALTTGLQVKVEVMNTATSARLQGTNVDVLSGDSVDQVVTVTLAGNSFAPTVLTGADVTSWFANLPGYGLTATVQSIDETRKIATIRVAGTVNKTPDPSAEVTATIPSAAFANANTDVPATGSFFLMKKQPRAEIIGDAIRNFYVNESGNTIVNIKLTNDTFTNVASTAEGDWFTGSLPADWTVQVAQVSNDTVSITFSAMPADQASIPLTFKVPASALTVSAIDLTAGTVTFNVVSRPKVATPTFGLAEGTYRGMRSVSIGCATEDATIFYKLDDAADWTMYVSPVLLTEGEHTLVAYATKDEFLDSDEAHADYIIEHDDNLIKNGYFDDGIDGWNVIPASADVAVVNGVLTITNFQGSNALEITASLKDGVVIQPNTKYRLSFNVNSDHPDDLKLKVVPGGNKSINCVPTAAEYNAEGNYYEFTTTDEEAALGTFRIYISSPRYLEYAVNGTFDNIVLSEAGGGTDPTQPTSPSQSQTSPSVTTPSASGTSDTSEESSTTSTPSGERTMVARWVTTGGISYSYLNKYNEAEMDIYGNCNGMKDGTTAMTWREFLAEIGNVGANQFFEIAYTHADGTSFFGAANNEAKTTLKNTGYNPQTTTLISADDLRVLFETNGALAYLGDANPQLQLKLADVTGVPAQGDIICTVTLYEGEHGGTDPTEPTVTSTTEGATTTTTSGEVSEPTPVSGNLIVNGDFSNGDNGWIFSRPDKSTITGGKLVMNGATSSKPVEIQATFTEVLGAGKTYTLRFDMENASNMKVRVHNNQGDNGYTEYLTGGTYTFTTDNGVLSSEADYRNRFDITIYGDANLPLEGTFDNFVLVEGDHIPSGGEPIDPTTYTVTVTGGNADKTTAEAGETITLTPPTSAPEGKEFAGWNVISGGVTVAPDNTFVMPSANVEIEAVYQWIEYSISVSNGNANGKSTAHLGESIQLNANAPETGKVFAGWTVTSPAGLVLDDASATMTTFVMPAADVVVEVTYDWIPYTITIHINNAAWGTASIVGGATTAHYTEQLTLAVNPAEGYELSVISVKNNLTTIDEANRFLMPNANVDIYVDFVKTVVPTHTVTVTDGIVTGGSATATVAEGSTVSVTANAPQTGYRFTGWTVESPIGLALGSTTAATTTFVMPTGDVAITAHFAKVDYTVTASVVANGTLTPDRATAQYGDTVTVTATPATGYRLGGITVNGNPITGNTFTMPAADVIVSATFEKQTYVITVQNDAAKGSVNAPATAGYGDSVTLTPVANTGWIFTGFTSGDVTITGNTFTMPAKAVTIIANYDPDPSMPVASWTNVGGASVYRNQTNGESTVTVAFNVVGGSGETFAQFVANNATIGADQYLKVTFTAAAANKFGNARRAATTLISSGYGAGAVTAFADDTTLTFYLAGSKASVGGDLVAMYANSSAVPAGTAVTTVVEIFNGTAPSVSVADVTADYTVTVVGGTTDKSSAKANDTVTVTPTVPSGKTFAGWTVDGTDYLFAATADANPMLTSFTMPYNNVKLTANFNDEVGGETNNLIINGDFSSGTTAWENMGVTLFEVDAGGVAHVINGNESKKALYQNVSFVEGHQYTLTATVSNLTGGDLRLYGNSTTQIEGITLSNGTVTRTFTATADMTMIMFAGSNREFNIDNIVLVDNTAGGVTPTTEPTTPPTTPSTEPTTPSTEPTTPPITGNLIVNGDFSSGTTDWENMGVTLFEVDAGGVAHVINGNESKKALYQNVSFVEGHQYTLTATVSNLTGGDLRLYGNSTTQIEGITLSNGTVTRTFTATADMTMIMFAGSNREFNIDNIVLVDNTAGGVTPTAPPTTPSTTPSTEPTVAPTTATTQPVGGGGTVNLSGTYYIKYADDGTIPDENFVSGTSVPVQGSTATITVTYPDNYNPSGTPSASSFFTVTVNNETVSVPNGTIGEIVSNNAPVVFEFTIPVDGVTNVVFRNVVERKLPIITVS